VEARCGRVGLAERGDIVWLHSRLTDERTESFRVYSAPTQHIVGKPHCRQIARAKAARQPLGQILQVLSLTLLEKTPILRALPQIASQLELPYSVKQLNLFSL
jgi:hypothetical protein